VEQILKYPPLIHVLWQNADIGLALVDKLGTFLSVNPRFCAMVEYSETELLSMSFQDITHPEDMDVDLIEAKKVSDLEKPFYILTKRYITKTDKIVWAKLHVEAIKDEKGGFMYFLSQIGNFAIEKPHATLAEEPKPKPSGLINWIKDNYKVVTVAILWLFTNIFLIGYKYAQFEHRLEQIEQVEQLEHGDK
jgi:PAS domain S-box-containing protein